MSDFKLWSEINNDAQKELKPAFGFCSWDQLNNEEKGRIWKYFEEYFFIPEIMYDHARTLVAISNDEHQYFEFSENDEIPKRKRINYSIGQMYNKYRANNYTRNFLLKKTHYNACLDFYRIFMEEGENVVFELLSFYSKSSLSERHNAYYPIVLSEDQKVLQVQKKEREQWEGQPFKEFAQDLNSVFSDFGVNLHLTTSGFAPRQDDRILNEVYEPVLKILSDRKWSKVNDSLSDAFSEFRINTPQGYSGCVTHTVNAVQAFLQILVTGKTGKGDISTLVTQAYNKNLIPNDFITKQILNTLISVFMKERQETGDAHPKKEYASEKNAKTLLNLSMVFIQHCLTD